MPALKNSKVSSQAPPTQRLPNRTLDSTQCPPSMLPLLLLLHLIEGNHPPPVAKSKTLYRLSSLPFPLSHLQRILPFLLPWLFLIFSSFSPAVCHSPPFPGPLEQGPDFPVPTFASSGTQSNLLISSGCGGASAVGLGLSSCGLDRPMTCRISVPPSGVETESAALEGRFLNHGATREVPRVIS